LQANVLRFEPQETYDFIWASGLFDYLSDATFVRLTRRLLAALRPGGELVIGNFGLHKPTRLFMELVLDWRLHNRSAAELLRLAALAGERRAEVGREAKGVNLFLHLRPGADLTRGWPAGRP